MQWLLQDISIGDNLRKIRDKEGYSQSELVAKLHLLGSNMSRTTYAKIETGVRNIRVSDLLALKVVYGIEFSMFFEGLWEDLAKNE